MGAVTAMRGFYADRLPAREPSFRDLWLAASDASEAVSDAYRNGLGERVVDRLESAAFDAEQSLRDHLLTQHGLTTADLKRSVL